MTPRPTLTPSDVDAIATRVVDLLRERPTSPRHVDTTTVARTLAVSEEWVRGHAAELGAIRVGDGPRGALRFDLERVREAMRRRTLDARASAQPRKPGPVRHSHVDLLPLPREAA